MLEHGLLFLQSLFSHSLFFPIFCVVEKGCGLRVAVSSVKLLTSRYTFPETFRSLHCSRDSAASNFFCNLIFAHLLFFTKAGTPGELSFPAGAQMYVGERLDAHWWSGTYALQQEVLHSSATIKNEEKGEREGKKKKANEISYATATRSL